MGEMTICNFCSLRRIKTDARKNKQKVEVVPTVYERKDKKYASLGGMDVLINGKKVAWFMELPNHCCC